MFEFTYVHNVHACILPQQFASIFVRTGYARVYLQLRVALAKCASSRVFVCFFHVFTLNCCWIHASPDNCLCGLLVLLLQFCRFLSRACLHSGPQGESRSISLTTWARTSTIQTQTSRAFLLRQHHASQACQMGLGVQVGLPPQARQNRPPTLQSTHCSIDWPAVRPPFLHPSTPRFLRLLSCPHLR